MRRVSLMTPSQCAREFLFADAVGDSSLETGWRPGTRLELGIIANWQSDPAPVRCAIRPEVDSRQSSQLDRLTRTEIPELADQDCICIFVWGGKLHLVKRKYEMQTIAADYSEGIQ